jgi:hypothetical protein
MYGFIREEEIAVNGTRGAGVSLIGSRNDIRLFNLRCSDLQYRDDSGSKVSEETCRGHGSSVRYA